MQKTALLLSNGMLVTGVLVDEEEIKLYSREVMQASREGVFLKDVRIDPPGRKLRWLFVPDASVVGEGEATGPALPEPVQTPAISGLADINSRSRR